MCWFSLKGFAEGEGPRPAGIAVGDVSAQIDAIVLGEIEAGAKAASRQDISRGERFPRWSDFADTCKRGKAPTRRENPAVLGLHSEHPVIAVSPRLVATDVAKRAKLAEFEERRIVTLHGTQHAANGEDILRCEREVMIFGKPVGLIVEMLFRQHSGFSARSAEEVAIKLKLISASRIELAIARILEQLESGAMSNELRTEIVGIETFRQRGGAATEVQIRGEVAIVVARANEDLAEDPDQEFTKTQVATLPNGNGETGVATGGAGAEQIVGNSAVPAECSDPKAIFVQIEFAAAADGPGDAICHHTDAGHERARRSRVVFARRKEVLCDRDDSPG